MRKRFPVRVTVLLFTILNILIAIALSKVYIAKDESDYAQIIKRPYPAGFECTERIFSGQIEVTGTRGSDRLSYSYNNEGISNYSVKLRYNAKASPDEIAQDVAKVMQRLDKVDKVALAELVNEAMDSDYYIMKKLRPLSGGIIIAEKVQDHEERDIIVVSLNSN